MTGDRSNKIVYLVTSGISARLLEEQLDYLDANGFEVVVGAGMGEGQNHFDESARVVDLGFEREIALRADLTSLFRCIRFLRRERPDIVSYSTPKAALIGAIASTIARVPHRVYVVRGLRYETTSGLGRRLLQRAEWLICRSAEAVVMNSQSLIDVAVQDGVVRRGRCRVLAGGSGNGIAIAPAAAAPVAVGVDEIPDSSSTQPPVVIGFVGRLTKDKGIEDLLQAFGRIAADQPDVKLLLAGDLEAGDAISEEAREQIQTDDNIEHLGWVDDPASVYASIDILAFPSYREGLPNVVLEAQLSGVPVVAYAATGTVDAMRDELTGVLVPVGDSDALATALERLVEDDDLRATLGNNGREFVTKNFSRAAVHADLLELYQSLLSSGAQEA